MSRDVVVGWSSASRRRMRLWLWERPQLLGPGAMFVTVTQGRDYVGSDEWRRMRRALLARLRREWPDVWGCWKVEPQGRLAAHDHDLLCGADDWPPFLEWLRGAVLDVVGYQGSPVAARRREAVNGAPVTSEGVAGYMVDELAKTKHGQATWAYQGRRWGAVNVGLCAEHREPGELVDVEVAEAMRARCWHLEDRMGWAPHWRAIPWPGVEDVEAVQAAVWLAGRSYRERYDAPTDSLWSAELRARVDRAVVWSRVPRPDWVDVDAVAWIVDGDLDGLERFVARRLSQGGATLAG